MEMAYGNSASTRRVALGPYPGPNQWLSAATPSQFSPTMLIEAEGLRTRSFRATSDIEVVDKGPPSGGTRRCDHLSATRCMKSWRKAARRCVDQSDRRQRRGVVSDFWLKKAGRSNFLARDAAHAKNFPVMATSEYQSNFKAPAPCCAAVSTKSNFAISTGRNAVLRLNGVYMHIRTATQPSICAACGPWATAAPASDAAHAGRCR